MKKTVCPPFNCDGMKRFIKECKKLNKILFERKDGFRDELNAVINKVYEKGGCLYWDREIYIDCNGDDEKMRALVTGGADVCFEPSDDPEEHPGVTVNYIRHNHNCMDEKDIQRLIEECWPRPFKYDGMLYIQSNRPWSPVFTAVCDGKSLFEEMVELLNGTGGTPMPNISKHPEKRDWLLIDDVPIGFFRGWGRLTGTGGGMALPEDVAVKVQDAFIDDCIAILTGKKKYSK